MTIFNNNSFDFLFNESKSDKLIQKVLLFIVKKMEACSASYYSLNEGDTNLILRERFPYDEWAINNIDDFTINVGKGMAGRSALQNTVLIENNVKVLDKDKYIELNSEVVSEVAIPISCYGMVIGVICIDWSHELSITNNIIEDAKNLRKYLSKKAVASVLQGVHLIRQLHIEQNKSKKHISFLREVSNNPCFSKQEAYDLLTKCVVDKFAAICCSYDIYNKFEETITVKSIYPQNHHDLLDNFIFKVNNSVVGQTISKKNVVETAAPNLEINHNNKRLLQELSVERLYSIPIEYDVYNESSFSKEIVGVINVYIDKKGRRLDKYQVDAIKQVAGNEIAQSALNERQKIIEIIRKNYIAVASSKNNTFTMCRDFNISITKLVQEILVVEGVSIFMLNRYSLTYTLSATTGIENSNNNNMDIAYTFEQGITGSVLSEGKTIISHDIKKDPRYRGFSREKTNRPLKSFMGTPLKNHLGSVIGCIRCTNKIPNTKTYQVDSFSQDDKDMLEFIAYWVQSYLEILSSAEVANETSSKNIHESRSQLGGIKTKTKSVLKYLQKKRYNSMFDLDSTKLLEKYLDRHNINKFLDDITYHSQYLYNRLVIQEFFYGEKGITLKKCKLWGDIIIPVVNDAKYMCIDNELEHKAIEYPNINIIQSTPLINADPEIFKEVFSNLLNNAIKYAYDDKSIFNIIIKQEIIGNEIKISVSDFGMGIKECYKEYIFLHAYRTPEAIEKNVNGKGMGLSIIKNILTAHNCRIVLERPSSPTTFTIFIPFE